MKLTQAKLTQIVAENLRTLRVHRRKLTQGVVAKRAGITVSYLSMLERGQRSPTILTLAALAKALGVTPSYLVEEPAHPRPRKRTGTG